MTLRHATRWMTTGASCPSWLGAASEPAEEVPAEPAEEVAAEPAEEMAAELAEEVPAEPAEDVAPWQVEVSALEGTEAV